MKARFVALLPAVSLLILALLAAAPLWGPGLVNTRAGGDSPFLLWRVHQMAANLRAGVFPVRWMPDAAYGYGYPFFSYYAALPFYLAGLLNLIGLDILSAIQLTQTLGFIAAAWAMYGWTRRHFSRPGAWLAAVAYTFASFHLVNVYTRGDSLSEFYAFIFFPLILWATDAAVARHAGRSAAALALAFGGLFVTHNLSALTFSLFVLPLYFLIRVFDWRARRFTFHIPALVVAGLALGLALSAWCWAPFFFEKDYGQLGDQTTGYFNYSNHFRGVDLVQPTLAFDYQVGETTPFAMGSAQTVLAMLGVGVMLGRAMRRRALDGFSVFILAGLAVSTWMITPLSKPVWEHVPFLPLIQFPWRFLTIQAVFTALATGKITNVKFQISNVNGMRNTQIVAVVLGLLLPITAMANLHPDRLDIGPADVTAERLQLYEMFTANIGTTIRYEYLPRGVVPRLYTSDALVEPGQPMRAAVLEGEADATRMTVAPTRQTWQVAVGSPRATVAFPILWWPGWQATVDAKSVAVHPASSGRIVLDVANGQHTVVLSLGHTPLRAIAEGVSLVAMLVALVLLIHPQDSFMGRGLDRRLIAGGALSVLLLILVVLAARAVLVSRSTRLDTANDLTMDFDAQPYLHHNPNGVELTPGLRLMTYSLSADEVWAGQTQSVVVNWRNLGQAQPVTVTLVSPAQHLVGLESAPTFAQSVAVVSGNQTTHSLAIPAEMPRGVYLVKVRAGAGAVYLRPVRVSARPAGDPAAVAQFGDRIRLHRVRAEQITPAQLSVTLDWSASKPVVANYAIAVRLRGVASLDTQPGYGFLPTSLWRPGELISDRYTLQLPEGTPPRSNYEIEVILYDAATQASIGRYVQTNVALTQVARRPADSPVLARFGSELALATLNVPATHPQGAPVLTIQAGWLALSAQSADRVARWTIYDSNGAPVLTQTSDLVAGLPSSAWPAGAYIVGETQLNLPARLEPGKYRLDVTVLDPATRAEQGRYLVPSWLELVGHPRSFAVPPMAHQTSVEFAGQIRLLGYDVQPPTSNLQPPTSNLQSPTSNLQLPVTLYWQALNVPRADYKVFIHLFDPANEHIAAQHDAMPLNGQYPTSWWAAGEVVSETVTLDLKDVKPGMYRLAVGLYELKTLTRLEAVEPGGQRLEADRLVLPENIAR